MVFSGRLTRIVLLSGQRLLESDKSDRIVLISWRAYLLIQSSYEVIFFFLLDGALRRRAREVWAAQPPRAAGGRSWTVLVFQKLKS